MLQWKGGRGTRLLAEVLMAANKAAMAVAAAGRAVRRTKPKDDKRKIKEQRRQRRGMTLTSVIKREKSVQKKTATKKMYETNK